MKQLAAYYPFFFAIYAVIGTYATNADEIPVQWVLRPLLVELIVVGIVFYILNRIYKDIQRAALVTTLFIFWLFFGHIQRFLSEQSVFWSTPLGTLIAFLLWSLPLLGLGSSWAWNRITNRKFITTFLGTTALIAVLLPGFVTARSLVETIWWTSILRGRRPDATQIQLEPQAALPDVYLIILDAYGREDFLRDTYGFDNREFIDYLENKGFYVADQSSPNYPLTVLSLTSLLNMSYLDEYTQAFKNMEARGPLYDLLQHNELRHLLKEAGYEFVALPSATLFTQMRDADSYYKMTLGDLNEFEGLLLSSTVANIGIEALHLDVPVPSYNLHRRYIQFTIDNLKTIPEREGPKFVFAHFMAPHPPFVFDEIGNPIQPEGPYNMGDAFSGFGGTPQDYMTGYIGEVKYMNQQVMDIIDIILARSEQPPIIILQGDHGPGIYFNLVELNDTCLMERYSILNAYYFPEEDYRALYPSITPVNSFRVVLNQYFGTELPMLEDRSFYSTGKDFYAFTDVTGQTESCSVPPKD